MDTTREEGVKLETSATLQLGTSLFLDIEYLCRPKRVQETVDKVGTTLSPSLLPWE